MKDPLERTKVVLRKLPPTLAEAALREQIDARFAGRYKWFRFQPGKPSPKNQSYSRAYIDFNGPEDVVEFAESFDGHVFVNEKGIQFKALVEYAPSQRVPKTESKKDGREGTILKDPEYLEFLENLAKPVEHLPSAEIQLERKEAERAAGAKEPLIVTPLMDFVRQKRAVKSGSQRSPANGRLSRKAGGASSSSSTLSSKRASDKRRVQTSMYVQRDNSKNGSGKDKGTYILVPRKEEQQFLEKSVAVTSVSGTAALADESGSNGKLSLPGGVETGKGRIVLLKGKDREGSTNPQTSARNSPGSTASSKQSKGQDASEKIIRSILLNKDARQNQSYLSGSHSEQQAQSGNLERDKRPPRPPNIRSSHIPSISSLGPVSDSDGKRPVEDKITVNDQHGSVSVSEKNDRRMRSKDRPDRVVWTLRRSDGSHAGDDISSSAAPDQLLSDSLESVSISQQAAGFKVGDDVMGVSNARGGRGTISAYEMQSSHGDKKPGSHRHIGRRGPSHGLKNLDSSQNFSEGKPSKRGGPAGHGSHERQIWVQKSGSGS